jgi:hypothetical protein
LPAALALGAPIALAQVQGVSKNEIVLGTAQDMSGPAVPFSKPAVNGMKMRIDEINDAGGIHGRKLKLVVEDHSYDPKKAVLAANKLTQKDKIFAYRPAGNADEPWRRCRSTSRRTCRISFPLSAGARNVRAAAQAQVLDGRDVLRADPRRAEAPGEGEGLQEGLHAVPGRRLRHRESRGAASRR